MAEGMAPKRMEYGAHPLRREISADHELGERLENLPLERRDLSVAGVRQGESLWHFRPRRFHRFADSWRQRVADGKEMPLAQSLNQAPLNSALRTRKWRTRQDLNLQP